MKKEDSDLSRTHLAICEELVGKVERIESGEYAQVILTTTSLMQADAQGLIHGGFTFGLADYAAMVAINDPYVVLLSSAIQFIRPVRIGDQLIAEATVRGGEGRKRTVGVEVKNQTQERVLQGEFECLILGRHVLEV